MKKCLLMLICLLLISSSCLGEDTASLPAIHRSATASTSPDVVESFSLLPLKHTYEFFDQASAAAKSARDITYLFPAYVGNANTHKFHEIVCFSIRTIKDSNKRLLYSRTEAIENSFEPCGRCHP